MKTKKEEIKLLPCYEHWFREWVEFYKNHKWVQLENGRWQFVESEITPVYKLTPEEELEAQEDERRSRLLQKLEDGEPINKQELTQDEKFLIWKHTYQKKGGEQNAKV